MGRFGDRMPAQPASHVHDAVLWDGGVLGPNKFPSLSFEAE